jgi:rod shape-determining protein MreC
MKTPTSRSTQSVVLALIAIGLIVLALSGYLAPLTRIVFTPFIAGQTWITTRYQVIQDLITSPSDMTLLRQRNAELESQVAQLQSQVIDLQNQISEVEILSALLDFARAHPENKYLGATVISYDTSPFMHYVVINCGSDQGVRRGMPVVTAQGLIGRITAVTAGAARIQLINDPGSHINIRLKPTEAQAVLSGSLTGDITLDNIPQDAAIQAGDLVLTSGLGGDYPSNLLIGQVSGVQHRAYELFQNASVQPVADFSKLVIVLVITNFNPVDITPLIPTPAP